MLFSFFFFKLLIWAFFFVQSFDSKVRKKTEKVLFRPKITLLSPLFFILFYYFINLMCLFYIITAKENLFKNLNTGTSRALDSTRHYTHNNCSLFEEYDVTFRKSFKLNLHSLQLHFRSFSQKKDIIFFFCTKYAGTKITIFL